MVHLSKILFAESRGSIRFCNNKVVSDFIMKCHDFHHVIFYSTLGTATADQQLRNGGVLSNSNNLRQNSIEGRLMHTIT